MWTPARSAPSSSAHQRVGAVAFCSDGTALASASADGTVRLWDLSSAPQRAAFRWHTDMVRAVAFSPDSRVLATASDDKTARLWDLDTGQERAVLKGHARPVQFVAFSADGKQVLTKDVGNIAHVWDSASGQLLAARRDPRRHCPRRVESRREMGSGHRGQQRPPDGSQLEEAAAAAAPACGTPARLARRAGGRAEKDKQWFAAGLPFRQACRRPALGRVRALRESLAWHRHVSRHARRWRLQAILGRPACGATVSPGILANSATAMAAVIRSGIRQNSEERR